MANNSQLSIDDLIKRIYKSYVDIKVGEFREIDRDMLLGDIGLLYSSIKDLYPTNNIPTIELDLANSNKVEEIEINLEDRAVESLDIQLGQDSKLDNTELNNKIETTKEEKTIEPSIEHKLVELDLSIFEDDSDFEANLPEKSISLLDKKSDNTSSPILNEFRTITSDAKHELNDYKEVPKIEDNSSAKPLAEPEDEKVIAAIPDEAIQVDKSEPEKKNANNIIDFLHHDEKKEVRDIYSFLDINTRIGLVELFFKGNSMELTECLVKLNKLNDREECIKVIDKFANTFGVEETDDIYKQFIHLIDRKLQYKA